LYNDIKSHRSCMLHPTYIIVAIILTTVVANIVALSSKLYPIYYQPYLKYEAPVYFLSFGCRHKCRRCKYYMDDLFLRIYVCYIASNCLLQLQFQWICKFDIYSNHPSISMYIVFSSNRSSIQYRLIDVVLTVSHLPTKPSRH